MDNAPQIELPRYECHKEVWALPISEIKVRLTGDFTLIFPGPYAPIVVDVEWFVKHKPVAGGFYVVYKDGYVSFSPRDAFMDGYTLIER